MIESFPDQGSIRFQKIRDAGGVLNASFELIRRNARELLVSFFAIVVPFALISGIGSAVYLDQAGNLLAGGDMVSGDFDSLTELFPPAYFFSILVGMLGTLISQAAAAGYVRLYREGAAGEITPGLLWEETRSLILPTLGYFIAVFLVVILSAVIWIVPCLGALAWFAFIVWAYPYATVAWVSRMIESDSLVEALGRANVLVKGAWGFAFGALLLVGIVTFLVIFALAIPLQAASMGVIMATGESGIAMTVFGLIAVPMQLLNYAAYLLPGLAGFFVHGRLAAELDGTDLDEDLDLLESGWEETPASSWSESAAPTGADATSTPPAPSEGNGDGSPERDSDRPSGGFRGGGFS
ncbi:MAG: hypothetical protein AAGI52_01500 [Bacteroidota bacterium]